MYCPLGSKFPQDNVIFHSFSVYLLLFSFFSFLFYFILIFFLIHATNDEKEEREREREREKSVLQISQYLNINTKRTRLHFCTPSPSQVYYFFIHTINNSNNITTTINLGSFSVQFSDFGKKSARWAKAKRGIEEGRIDRILIIMAWA